MANDESFVSPKRGGGSGAAAILTPSTAINDVFKTYDAQHKPASDPFLDSLGKDIKEGFNGVSNIYEPDRPYIAKEVNKLKDLQAKAYQARATYSTHPEVYQAIDLQKQVVNDIVSKSQRTQKDFGDIDKELKNNWHKYDDSAKQAFDEWLKKDPYTREARPDFRPLDSANYQEIAKKWGTKNQQGYYSIANYKDQNGVTRSGYVFNEKLAADDWDNLIRTESGTQNMSRFLGRAAELTQKEAGDMWDTMPQDVKLEAVNETAKQMFVDSMRMQTPTKSVKSSMTNTDKGGSGKRDPKEFINQFKITPLIDGNNLKRVVNLELLGFENTEKNNAIQELQGANVGKVVIGRPQRISQVEGQPAYIEVAVTSKDGNPSLEYVPYTKNKEKVQKLYRVDFYADRPKEFKSQYENYQVPIALSRSKETTDEEYARALKEKRPIIERFNKRKKTTEAAPASKKTSKLDEDAIKALGGTIRK